MVLNNNKQSKKKTNNTKVPAISKPSRHAVTKLYSLNLRSNLKECDETRGS